MVAATTTADGSVEIETVTDAPRQNHQRTMVVSPDKPSARQQAKLVGAAIPGATLEVGRTSPGVDVAVTVGKRFETERIVQIVPIPIPEPADLPEECQE